MTRTPEDLRSKATKELDAIAMKNWDCCETIEAIRDEALRRYNNNPRSKSKELYDKIEVRLIALRSARHKNRPVNINWLLASALGLLGAIIYGIAHSAGQDIWKILSAFWFDLAK